MVHPGPRQVSERFNPTASITVSAELSVSPYAGSRSCSLYVDSWIYNLTPAELVYSHDRLQPILGCGAAGDRMSASRMPVMCSLAAASASSARRALFVRSAHTEWSTPVYLESAGTSEVVSMLGLPDPLNGVVSRNLIGASSICSCRSCFNFVMVLKSF